MSQDTHRMLLTLDAAINAVLGVLLLILPGPTILFLGLPEGGTHFYASVLGAVLLGIAIALWIERRGRPGGRGLGIAGAIAINILGALAVLAWLIFGGLTLPWRGFVALWIVVLVVLGTAIAELVALIRHRT